MCDTINGWRRDYVADESVALRSIENPKGWKMKSPFPAGKNQMCHARQIYLAVRLVDVNCFDVLEFGILNKGS